MFFGDRLRRNLAPFLTRLRHHFNLLVWYRKRRVKRRHCGVSSVLWSFSLLKFTTDHSFQILLFSVDLTVHHPSSRSYLCPIKNCSYVHVCISVLCMTSISGNYHAIWSLGVSAGRLCVRGEDTHVICHIQYWLKQPIMNVHCVQSQAYLHLSHDTTKCVFRSFRPRQTQTGLCSHRS